MRGGWKEGKMEGKKFGRKEKRRDGERRREGSWQAVAEAFCMSELAHTQKSYWVLVTEKLL